MTSPFDSDQELAEYSAAQVQEWSKWEARDVIEVNGARAYNPGDPVPTSNVERHDYAKAGKVRLQNAWIADNPDDDDVKKFHTWAKSRSDHPDVTAWETYRTEREAADEQAVADNPFADTPAPARTGRRAASTSSSTSSSGTPAGTDSSKE